MSHCTVIIPTKNGIRTLPQVLDALDTQQAPWAFDILLMDSGSTDGSVEEAVRRGIRLLSIPPEEFGHGKTRNQAIKATQSPFIAMITQDAIPADELWLWNLVSAVQQRDDVGGAFGCHIAHAGADPFTSRDLERHFEGFRSMPAVVSFAMDPERYQRDERWRQALHFFSDNNACLRRAVWERIPYPEVSFGEDQLWAKLIIEGGYAKAYAHDAVVRHSHQFSHWRRLQRSFLESRSFRQNFGYELSPRVRDFCKNLESQSRQDLWDWRQGIVQASTGELVRRVVANAFHQSGQYLGTNADRIPAWMNRALSPEGES